AIRTHRVATILRKKYSHVQLVLLCIEPVEETRYPVEAVSSLYDCLLLLASQLAKRNVGRDAGLFAKAKQLLLRPIILWLHPRLDRAFGECQLAIGNHQIEVQSNRIAEALTGRARAEWIVKTEQLRLGRGISNRAALALEALRKYQSNGRVICGFDYRLAVTLLITDLERINQPRSRI